MLSPYPNQFSRDNASVLCAASAAAYDLQGDGLPDNRAQICIESKATDSRALLICTAEDIIIAFRGTSNLRNWLTDVDVKLTPFTLFSRACKVHAGFLGAWLSVKTDVLSKLLKRSAFATPVRKRIWITGHSLGGALAMLAAADLFGNENDVAEFFTLGGVYTFGQPRPGPASFVAAYDPLFKKKTFRAVNGVDVVPHIPWLCGRYRHAGHEVFYAVGRGSAEPIIDRAPLLYAASDIFAMAKVIGRWTTIDQWLADHHISRYAALFYCIPKNENPGAGAPGAETPSAPPPGADGIGNDCETN